MKKKYRIKKDKEFQSVIHNKQSYANKHLILYVLKKNNQDLTRVGISVGKKIGNAVRRNYVKRQLREGLREVYPNMASGYDLIFIARPAMNQLTTKEVQQNIIHILNLAELWNKEEVS